MEKQICPGRLFSGHPWLWRNRAAFLLRIFRTAAILFSSFQKLETENLFHLLNKKGRQYENQFVKSFMQICNKVYARLVERWSAFKHFDCVYQNILFSLLLTKHSHFIVDPTFYSKLYFSSRFFIITSLLSVLCLSM